MNAKASFVKAAVHFVKFGEGGKGTLVNIKPSFEFVRLGQGLK